MGRCENKSDRDKLPRAEYKSGQEVVMSEGREMERASRKKRVASVKNDREISLKKALAVCISHPQKTLFFCNRPIDRN